VYLKLPRVQITTDDTVAAQLHARNRSAEKSLPGWFDHNNSRFGLMIQRRAAPCARLPWRR